MNKSKVKTIVLFIISFLFLLIGLIADFIIIPDIYGEDVSFMRWVFTNPSQILDTLGNPSAVLPGVDSMVGKLVPLCILVWFISLTISLFFLGRQFHIKSELVNANAVLVDKEPYIMIQSAGSILKQLKVYRNNEELKGLLYSVKCLEEKLLTESDFGYGSDKVVNCENEIAQQLQILLDNLHKIENGDFDENVKTLNALIVNINSLLQRRGVLKRR